MKYHIKRLADIIISLVALMVLFPVYLLISLWVALDSPGPVLFIQTRMGRGGKPFRFLKFRTMVQNAQNMGPGLAVSKDDFRITRAGTFLRESTLDELPQLWNVLKGEMSLVGPRPLPKYPQEDAFSKELWQKRLSVKPGLICLVDIKGRALVPWEKRLQYDAWYADNWSLWLDLNILVVGFFTVLSRKGVYGKDGTNKPPERKS
ncbi:MAG: sugar transferase [bacterium]|nr:sugar transferase [bacterium]